LFPICFGTGDYFWNASCSDREKINVIRRAIDSGINIIDTAPEYGNGKSEQLVHTAIKGNEDQVIICTKVSPRNFAYKDLIKSVEKSLWYLGVDRIDLLTLHWPNPNIPCTDTIEGLLILLESNKIASVGLSNFTLKSILLYKELLQEYLSTIQMEFNLNEQTIKTNGVLDYCKTQKMPLMGYSPLDQGRLYEFSEEQSKILEKIEIKYGVTRSQVILSYIISQSPIYPIIRTTSLAHLKTNVEAINLHLDDTDMKIMNSSFPASIHLVETDKIEVCETGEWDHDVYLTYEEALANKFNHVPSPEALAKFIKRGEFLKPVRLRKKIAPNGSKEYLLIGGRVRFWAWQIAHKNKNTKIAAYIKTQ